MSPTHHYKQTAHKLFPRILVGLNLFFILLLLCGSGILATFSLSGESVLFGYRALLEAPSREGGAPESDRFLLYRPLEDDPPQVGDRILLQSDSGELVLVDVLRTDGASFFCKTDAGRSVESTVRSPECLGKIITESGVLGHFFARIGNHQTLPLAILVISAAVLFVCVCLLSASIFSARKRPKTPSTSTEINAGDEQPSPAPIDKPI